MPPYTAAKMVASLGSLYGRRLWLNMLAGGFRNDLIALGDETAHDDRYARTVEYALLMRQLLESDPAGDLRGPLLPRAWRASGAGTAGRVAAWLADFRIVARRAVPRRSAMGAIAVEYPAPAGHHPHVESLPTGRGIRVGIIARDNTDVAWDAAHARFPDDRRGRLSHALAMKTSDSAWHRTLSDLARDRPADGSPYWLWPFEQHRTFCPYLVGDFATVAEEIARYLMLGYTDFILDIPTAAEDLETASIVFRMAEAKAAMSAPLGLA